ncbi:MAG: MarR family winged helix-turn-helix transcriptional regulator [Maricaulaceae bacterium]
MAIARPVDRRLFFMLDRAHTRLTKAADNHLAGTVDISSSQAAVLTYLGYHDNCRLTELADGVGRNNSAITGLVTRMETAGLVQRDKGTSDRRAKTVSLTNAGWVMRETVMNEFRDFNEQLAKGMSASEMDAVMKFLNLAADNVKTS